MQQRPVNHMLVHILCFFSICLLLTVKATRTSHAQGIITDLSKTDVPIEWNFTGTSILLFGAIEKHKGSPDKLDVIIVVKGPDKRMYARKKERVAGIWVNTKSKGFREVPAYYSIVSTRPITDITSPKNLELLGIGFKALALNLAQRDGKITKGKPDEYSKAIIRLMKKDGLYNTDTQGATITGGKLFRANIDLPSNVPVGSYHADVYLFHDGQLASISTRSLRIQKKGVEQLIYLLAYDFPLLYGIIAVAIAILSGLAATAMFRDD